MPFRTPLLLNAGLSVAAIAAPLAIMSSSAPGLAETVEPSAPVQVVPAPAPAATPDIPLIAEPTVEPTAVAVVPSVVQHEAECIAKIIMHEAAYEPRAGRVAVAQVVHARTRDGRFAATPCAVARQRGQFFDIDSFRPSRNERWDDAVAIAHEVLRGDAEPVAPGALFFHASYSPMPGRQRIAQIGGHVFYR